MKWTESFFLIKRQIEKQKFTLNGF
jgi:hypothetical protein